MRACVLAGVLSLWSLAGGCASRRAATDVTYVGAARPVDLGSWTDDDAGSADASGAHASRDAAAALDDAGAAPTQTLRFEVLTKSQGGHYSPRNIGAIWIEDDHGKWVKTLALWAKLRVRYLAQFNAAARGNSVDAVTSATLPQHVVHRVTWDMTDVHAALAPDGNYSVKIEVTDGDYSGDSTAIAFVKGAKDIDVSPKDTASYVDMRLTLH